MSDDNSLSSLSTVIAKDPDSLVGRVFNERFKVISLIARGGMGAVYKAEQAPLGRMCALKVLSPRTEVIDGVEFHKRFFLEASIVSKLTHPNTVTIFDYGKADDDIYFMAMEYLEGQTLQHLLRDEGFLPEERALHIARQICRALREAHSLGVIHRDIKPANIFLAQHGDEPDFAKILDFGLVKDITTESNDLTQAGIFMGSPKYMSPEQIRGDEVDVRSDVYSLGIVLYEMVAGKPPFEGNKSVSILLNHVNDAPPPLAVRNPNCNVSPFVEQLIFRCLAKDPNDRFPSMGDMLMAMKQASGGALSQTMTGSFNISSSYPAANPGSGPNIVNPGGQMGIPSGPHVFVAGQSTSQTNPVMETSQIMAMEDQNRKRRTMTLVGGGVFVVAAVAAAFFVGSRRPNTNAANGTPTSNVPSAAVTNSPTETTSAGKTALPATPPSSVKPDEKPKQVSMTITSDPKGASVREGSHGKIICNETPCTIKLEGADAEAGKQLAYYVDKSGFKGKSVTFTVGGKDPEIVKLDRQTSVYVAPPPTPRRQGGSTYRPDPYANPPY
jgi:eukaryotic-like serine/threonine-protein kinase